MPRRVIGDNDDNKFPLCDTGALLKSIIYIFVSGECDAFTFRYWSDETPPKQLTGGKRE